MRSTLLKMPDKHLQTAVALQERTEYSVWYVHAWSNAELIHHTVIEQQVQQHPNLDRNERYLH